MVLVMLSGLPGVGTSEVAQGLARRLHAADAANYLEVGPDIWRRAATEAEAPVKAIESICSDPVEHRQRLESRRRELEAYPEPTGDSVTRRATDTEPWSTEHHVIDSLQPLESSLADAMGYLVP